jgi:ABC-type phosphate transport system substrate-binding protein
MISLRKLASFSRWQGAVLCLGLLATLVAACSVLLDHDKNQCNTDGDCAAVFGGRPFCDNHVCVASGLGPDGCFSGVPSTPQEFANQCSTSRCERFDNCKRIGLCKTGDAVPPALPPPDAGPAPPPVDAPPPAVQPCTEAGRNTIVISGSTAIQPFFAPLAQVLATNTPPYQLAYQPSGSCAGVEGMFSPDVNKHVIKDLPGRQAVLYGTNGVPTDCTLGPAGTPLDVGVSDVFASSCVASYAPSDTIAEYLGPIQAMAFVVPTASSQTAISAEMARVVFGRGRLDPSAAPWTDPGLYFVRNSGSGTQQMLSRAISVDARRWWGSDYGSNSRVRDTLKAVQSTRADGAIGILSTDVADEARGGLRVLAFQGEQQLCGYYPDSSQFTKDKAAVRDGHYSVWGPIHFFARVSGGIPTSPAAAALVTRFSLAKLDKPLLDAIIKIGFVPPCAMKVQRKAEMGPISAYAADFQCGCYFEATVEGGAAPASCKACSGPADCPAGKPACNLGYCEQK